MTRDQALLPRSLVALAAPRTAFEVEAFLPHLGDALEATGPAVAPLPDAPAELIARLTAAVAPDAPVEIDDLAVVVTTSGSTGVPKGVLLTRSALRASAYATQLRLGGPARWVLALPVQHVAGLQVLVRSLLAGTTPVVLDMRVPFDVDAFAAATDSAVGSRLCTSLVPTQLRRLLATPAGVAALCAYDAVLLGGAATPAPLLDEARAGGVAVVTTYGMTETCGGCVYDGVPLDGVQVRARSDGRLQIGGPVLAAGYRLQPELTDADFSDGWFTTGDLGRVDDHGTVTVLGRADDVVISGGENVALAAVEAALAGLPGVAEVAAFVRPDEEWGQRVAVAVVAAAGATPPTVNEMRQVVGERLGRHAAPRDVLVLDALPMLASGKVDRAALQRIVG